MSAGPLPRYTPGQYLAYERGSEGPHEYYDGMIYAMAGGSFRHGQIISSLTQALGGRLRDRDCFVIPSDLRVQVSAEGPYFYPDVVVVCGEPAFADSNSDNLVNPLLIVEVLSPATATYDR